MPGRGGCAEAVRKCVGRATTIRPKNGGVFATRVRTPFEEIVPAFDAGGARWRAFKASRRATLQSGRHGPVASRGVARGVPPLGLIHRPHIYERRNALGAPADPVDDRRTRTTECGKGEGGHEGEWRRNECWGAARTGGENPHHRRSGRIREADGSGSVKDESAGDLWPPPPHPRPAPRVFLRAAETQRLHEPRHIIVAEEFGPMIANHAASHKIEDDMRAVIWYRRDTPWLGSMNSHCALATGAR
ncbi:hypothetical protein C8J57DRAFT_1235971 [Mycena rebaudengoi]|nr:hypothetical protein C8J57DRAFT_1235971 [Mycena rebaudengoi]